DAEGVGGGVRRGREGDEPVSLGDNEHPISIVLEPRFEGAHVKVVVRAGLRGMRALTGELTFRPEECLLRRAGLADHEEVPESVAGMVRYQAPDIPPERHWLNGVRLVYFDFSTPIEIAEMAE